MPKRLVVVVPSVMRRLEDWSALIGRVQELDGYGADEADWFLLDHHASLSTRRSATSLAATVAAEIHQRVQSRGPFDDVVLVGHSLGGMLVRSAYVQARLAAADERHPQWPWLVTRIVLFASLNRGMEVSRHRRWWLPLVFWFARVLPWVRGFLLHDLLRGSAFVSSLRIEWIRIMSSGRAVPLVVQHLGTEDDLVTAQESTDIETFPTGRTVSLPGATHGDLVHLESASDPDGRFALIRPAFADPVPAAVPVGDPDQQIVLLLHGIRASNEDWAAGLRDEIATTWPRALVSASEYGRFSARQFVLPATRRKFLGWLQDEYAEALARNPSARFYFVGHSNGTYLFGRSLLAVPAMRFERVLLVGSVLPRGYDWRGRFASGQVGELRNDRGSTDVPVGVLCGMLRGVGMTDVGTGGVDGFDWEADALTKLEVRYHPGGHSRALLPDNLPSLAAFVTTGDRTLPGDLVERRPGWFSTLVNAAPWLGRLLALALVAGAVALVLAGPFALLGNLLLVLGIGAAVLIGLDVA